jgi:hypothetical protein
MHCMSITSIAHEIDLISYLVICKTFYGKSRDAQ